MHLLRLRSLLPLFHLLHVRNYPAANAATATVTITAPAPCFTPTSPLYYLKTHVLDNGNSSKNGLYLDGYHTGAGRNDAVLVPKTAQWNLAKGWLDGSYQQFDLGSYFPWSMTMGTNTNDAGFESAFIDAGVGQSGFSFSGGSGLQWDSTVAFGAAGAGNEFLGWLACDWVHGVSQLFWLSAGKAVAVPSNCAKVELVQEMIRK